ncbi:hypothetical protein [Xenorhabdus griffiniae]|uniref:Uncharacterized protein n=1 Tax=Xenorhabdus griffiniae TaxID=351672 RepID=A0ABY9XEV3_9GAMM|nr:hypothetical protein [Xenorhabdus griffiniae]MBD1225972.1 hypothetical protein [Xenorhabdus griffiniae]MBE8585910.1 hypothetical protein [Xenorhabdus griffiniae]WMV71452.1 hypothetical protein QL128_14940 [Xenorhabdus griffiniae]WNH01129.1 hypothetical protein QL112_014945 [Xenorhabdus griffiniae]
MFKKLLTTGALVATLIGGVGTASALGTAYYCPESMGGRIYDQAPGKELTMWVVHSTRVFSNSFEDFGRKWNFTGTIWECYLDRGYEHKDRGPKYYAAKYGGEWVNKPR